MRKEDRACNACDWAGPESECLLLGGIEPLCPKCQETTNKDDQDKVIAWWDGGRKVTLHESLPVAHKWKTVIPLIASQKFNTQVLGDHQYISSGMERTADSPDDVAQYQSGGMEFGSIKTVAVNQWLEMPSRNMTITVDDDGGVSWKWAE